MYLLRWLWTRRICSSAWRSVCALSACDYSSLPRRLAPRQASNCLPSALARTPPTTSVTYNHVQYSVIYWPCTVLHCRMFVSVGSQLLWTYMVLDRSSSLLNIRFRNRDIKVIRSPNTYQLLDSHGKLKLLKVMWIFYTKILYN